MGKATGKEARKGKNTYTVLRAWRRSAGKRMNSSARHFARSATGHSAAGMGNSDGSWWTVSHRELNSLTFTFGENLPHRTGV